VSSVGSCHQAGLLGTVAPVKYPHTTAYLAEIAKVEPATILEWRTIGLFQGIATTKQGGDRKGVRRLWQAEAADRVREIVRLKADGYDREALIKHFAAAPAATPERGED